MKNEYFLELERDLGVSGMKALLAEMTCLVKNNWVISKEWGLTIHDVRFLRRDLEGLCGHVLRREAEEASLRRPAKILNFTAA